MSKARILIVEDEAIVARDIRQQLIELGYEPVADTPRGEEAVVLAGELRPDLVLMDIRLAGEMDGIAAAQTIRDRLSIPVVFLTAFAGDDMLGRAKLTEPFGFIVKPFDERELRTVIEMALYKHAIEARLRRSYEEQAALLRTALDGFALIDLQGRILDANDSYCRMTGYTRDEILRMSIADLEADHISVEIAAQIERIVEAGSVRFERRHRCKDGHYISVELSVNYLPVGEGRLFCVVRDVTERKRLEEEREVTVRLLALANGLGNLHDLMQAVTLMLRDCFGCEAVGVRLKAGEDFPYFETRGFPAQFVRAEARLCQRDAAGQVVHDAAGHPVLECMCGNIVCGRFDPTKPFFTERGTFWTNSTTDLLASTTEADRQANTRNRCHREGYESVALVPLRVGTSTLGLLQLNDRRRNRFTAERIAFCERLADTLSVVLAQRQAREEIQLSERKFRSYIDYAPVGVLVIDRASRYVEVNPAAARMLGYTEPEVLQLHVADVRALDEQERGTRRVARLLAGEAVEEEVAHLRRKDGAEFWASVMGVKLSDDRVMSLVQDITARQQAEAALRESEAKFAKVFHDAPVWISITDLQDATFVDVNGQALRDSGFTREEVIGRTSSEIGWMQAADRARLVSELQAHGRISDLEMEFRAKDGRPLYGLVNGEQVVIGGRPSILTVTVDITARKQAAAALRESEVKLRAMFESSRDAINVSKEGRHVFANPACLKLFGFAENAEIVGASIFDHIAPIDRQQLRQIVQQRSLGEPTPKFYEARCVNAAGGEFDAEFSVSTYELNGEIFTLAYVRDISARKQAEATLRESEARLSAMFESSKDAIGVSKNGRHLYANGSYLKLFGFEKNDEILGTSIIESIAPSHRAEMIDRVQRRTAGDPVAKYYETRGIRVDGSEFDAETSVSTYELNGEIFSVAYIRDITERKQAEMTLLESEERYRTLVELSPEAIFVHAEGRIIFANQAAAQLGGAETPEAMLGLRVMDFVQPESQTIVQERIKRMATVGEVAPLLRQKWRRLDGTPIEVEVVAKALQFTGQAATLVIALNVTAQRQAEAELRKLSRAVEQSPVTVVITDTKGAIEYANPSFTATTGYTLEEARGQNPRILRSGKLPADVHRDLWSTITAGREWRGEFHNRKKNGELFWETATISPILDEAGKITHFLAVKEDITARKAALETLQRSEQRFRSLVESLPNIAVQGYDRHRRVVFWNPASTTLYGYTREEALGRQLEELIIPPAMREHVIAAVDRWVTHGEAIPAGELVLRRKDGGPVHVFSSHVMLQQLSGELEMYCIDIDLTERKSAEDKVREQAALLEVTQDAIMVLSLERVVTFWNHGAEQLYGVSREQAIGRRYETLVYRELPASYEADWRKFLEQGEWAMERRQVGAAQAELTVQMRATLVRDEQGATKSALIVVTDVTESKRLEAQFLRAQRLESLGSLASGVAHDLNNVLTPILMSVELLRPLARVESDHETLQLLSDSARRGADIVQQLLLFGRGSDSPRAPLNAGGVIKEVGKMMRQTFPKSVRLSVQAPADLWLIEGDRTQIHQVILNLCVNARDAMPEGGRLAINAENQHVDERFATSHGGTHGGAYVRIDVQDTGTGIPAALLEKIFDPFFTTKPAGEGTGLGLATVLGIVRSHAGFLTVMSREGHGTVFGVYFPAAQSAVETLAESPGATTKKGHDEWVLIVEDEEGIRSALQQVLLLHQYHVLVATDGAEALGVYAQHAAKVKLVITDLMMPVMDGTQMMGTLRRLNPDLPVVAITGMVALREEFEKKFAPGVTFLPKPFTSALALRAVREALDKAYPTKD